MQINEKIKVLRMFKGWSQEEIAEKLEYSLSGYKKIEHGETDLQLSKLEKIANVLGINLQNLLGMNDANVFNVAETCANNVSHYTVVLSETQCVHELEKCRLLLLERDKEIRYLKEIIELLKSNSNLQDGNAK